MIYLDHAATTKPAKEVIETMAKCLEECYGNPSAIYGPGAKAKKEISQARRGIAESLGCDMNEIFFTAGGSESDNWAIKAVAEAMEGKGKHIITTAIEHHAVLHTCQYLERRGFKVTYLPVDQEGMVDPRQLEAAITPDTILISVMYANNEIGTIEPIEEIGRIAKAHNILFHTDAVQVYGQIPIDINKCNIDLLSASGHKFHGPKGVGFLYVRNTVKIGAFVHGGAQERGRRAGTENVPGIAGMAVAAKLAMEHLDAKSSKERELRDYLMNRLLQEIPDCKLNGHKTQRLPGNVNVSFPGIEGESLLIMLDMQGICASSGSACTAGSLDPSHVLIAIGLNGEEAKGSLRLTLSEENTKEEVDTVVEAIKQIVKRLRSMSATYCATRK